MFFKLRSNVGIWGKIMWLKELYMPNIMKWEVPQTTKVRVRVIGKITNLVNIVEKWVTHHSNVGGGLMQSVAKEMSVDRKLWFQKEKLNNKKPMPNLSEW